MTCVRSTVEADSENKTLESFHLCTLCETLSRIKSYKSFDLCTLQRSLAIRTHFEASFQNLLTYMHTL